MGLVWVLLGMNKKWRHRKVRSAPKLKVHRSSLLAALTYLCWRDCSHLRRFQSPSPVQSVQESEASFSARPSPSQPYLPESGSACSTTDSEEDAVPHSSTLPGDAEAFCLSGDRTKEKHPTCGSVGKFRPLEGSSPSLSWDVTEELDVEARASSSAKYHPRQKAAFISVQRDTRSVPLTV
mmetsp:Transcript_1483/g.3091  ORF Transcript_1483/g.3091 Transcript_1483/m.3091 type:complete len:180 (-) Transcript_1483:1423-1962(-)